MAEAPDLLPDQEPGCPHPRETFALYGHQEAEHALATALAGPRMHHAWIIAGPKGCGKATLAYRVARRALGAAPLDPATLATSPDDPVCRKIGNGAHPDVRTATRWHVGENKIGASIAVDTIRSLTSFFELCADDAGGRRVAIIDAADEMNPNAANALLKTLEEPPPGALILLVTHAPGRLLPTIKSRCRRIDLKPLDDAILSQATKITDDTLIGLARGAPGRALALGSLGAGGQYRALSTWLSMLPKASRKGAQQLAASAGTVEKFKLFADILADWLARAARAGTGLAISEIEPGESLIMARLAQAAGPEACGKLWTGIQQVRGQVEGINLDPTAAVLHTLNLVAAGLAGNATTHTQ
jgi:DNA polymerase III subunit delta'